MDTLITYGIGGIICFFFLMIYLKRLKKREAVQKTITESHLSQQRRDQDTHYAKRDED